MTTQSSKQTPKRRRVKFTFNASEAKRVCLAGDFNNWSEKSHVMNSAGNGMWSKTLMLTPGTYEYKLKVDDRWVNDPQNEQSKLNCFGTENNLIQVQ